MVSIIRKRKNTVGYKNHPMFKLFMVLNKDNIDLHVRHWYKYINSRLAQNQDNVSESRATCLSAYSSFNELYYKNQTKGVCLVQSRLHHHLIEN